MKRTFFIDLPRKTVGENEAKVVSFWKRNHNAKRFFVPKETVDFLNAMGDDDRVILRSMRKFAKPPFDQVYAEFENQGAFNGDLSDNFGVMIAEGKAAVCAVVDGGNPFMVNAIMRIDDHHYIDLTNPRSKHIPDHDKLANLMRSCIDFCEIMFLLMLRPGAVSKVDVPHERGIEKGKLKTWRAHSVLNISLTGNKDVRTFITGLNRGICREHEVRRHWTHYPKTLLKNGCVHNWVRGEDTEKGGERWRCQNCNGVRTEKLPFVRGDGKLGTMFHTYNVKV